MQHQSTYRVYYEDTDAGGVVYYANYLKFAERARTEMLRDLDIHQSALAEERNILFVVRKAMLDLQRPARLDDLLSITTTVEKVGAATLEIRQELQSDEQNIARIDVTIATIDQDFKPKKIPADIRQLFMHTE